MNRENGYGRLETASAQVQGNYPNSIKLSEYSAAMEELENGKCVGKPGIPGKIYRLKER